MYREVLGEVGEGVLRGGQEGEDFWYVMCAGLGDITHAGSDEHTVITRLIHPVPSTEHD